MTTDTGWCCLRHHIMAESADAIAALMDSTVIHGTDSGKPVGFRNDLTASAPPYWFAWFMRMAREEAAKMYGLPAGRVTA